MAESSTDVVVIGAGFAGLRAALKLQAAGLRAVVLEARDRVGGRSRPARVGPLDLDSGGQWEGAGHTELAGLADAYGVTRLRQYDRGKVVTHVDDDVVRARSGWIPALPLPALADLGVAIVRLQLAARGMRGPRGPVSERVRTLDTLTFAQWRDRYVRSAPARATLDIFCRAVWCMEPHEVSLAFVLDYIARSGHVAYLSGTAGAAQAFRYAGGMHQLAVRMAADLADGSLRLGTPVTAVDQSERGVEVRTEADTVAAAHAIVAMAPSACRRIDFGADVSGERARLHEGTVMGSVVKVQVLYDRPFWREQGFTGEVVSTHFGFGPCFDGTPERDDVGLITGFFVGEAARTWGERDTEARRAEVTRMLGRYFGDEALRPTAYSDYDWQADPWSEGCYTATMPPGLLSASAAALARPSGRIHWAGTETAERFPGYLEGALRSGDRAAREVLERRG